jgi:predicted small metal-binding protein
MKCPWYIHYNEHEEFDKTQDLADHLEEKHEPRFVARELAEMIFKHQIESTPWTHRDRQGPMTKKRLALDELQKFNMRRMKEWQNLENEIWFLNFVEWFDRRTR